MNPLPLPRLGLACALAALAFYPHPTFAQNGGRPQGPDRYRQYALTREGDATRGARLFADEQKLACAKCHSVDGKGGKAGPDLYAAGDKFARKELIEAILQPSATIAVGYTTTVVATKSGAEYTGIVKRTSPAGVEIMGADGQLVSIPAADIQEQHGSPISLMPEGLQAGLSQAEFTDLIDYLATLRQPESALSANRGMPPVIPELAHPAPAQPWLVKALTLPRGRAEAGLTDLHQIPGDPNRFLVLHQKGIIWLVEKNAAGGEDVSVFSDLTGEVFSERGPNGLLGVTFHPAFRQNRKYYLKYQILENGKVTTLLQEKLFAPDFRHDSGQPPRRLLAMVSVADDHSGGCIQFGPDGFLYLAMGDTGPQMDPNGHAQDLGKLLGKVLRFDVDHTEGTNAYAIPRDNPFRTVPGARPEIWALGFRNPWRFCFDSLNGDLWLADVGQDRVEEVDLVRRGQNYGWNVYEAFESFSNQYRQADRAYTPPVFAYKRKYGNSITGGYVYRGDAKSSFYGVYVCGDYNSKRIFGVTHENGALKTVHQISRIPQRLVSFGYDEAGNIYAVGYEGMIYRLDLAAANFNELKPE